MTNGWKYASSGFLALVLVAGLCSSSVAAGKKKGVGKTIESSEITDGTIECADIAESVFPNGCPDDDTGGNENEIDVGAQNAFVDGFTTADQPLPSTSSGNDPAASIAQLTVGEGTHVIFASIVWAANPLNFSGIVTCHLVPPNGPNSKAEFQGTNTTVGSFFVQTTNSGAGVVDFRCSDQLVGSDVFYRFLQLTAIQVPTLTRTNLLP